MDNRLLDSAVNGTKRAGQIQLIKYLKGTRLTRQEAIKAKCYDCDGMGDSGVCNVEGCPLLPYSPFNRS